MRFEQHPHFKDEETEAQNGSHIQVLTTVPSSLVPVTDLSTVEGLFLTVLGVGTCA